MSSANAFILDQSKILLFGKELKIDVRAFGKSYGKETGKCENEHWMLW